MQIHDVKREHGNTKKRRVGRGGGRGKTSGRGHKGQKARAGGTPRPAIRDMIKKLPKQRGYRFSPLTKKAEVVNVSLLNDAFEAGEKITPRVLHEKKLVRLQGGKLPVVKILGNGELTKKLEVVKCKVSDSAKTKIESAGGKVG